MRDCIYQYVLPPEHDRIFRSKRRFLPDRSPALLFVSREIRKETILLYFRTTNWTFGVRRNLRGKGYHLLSAERKSSRLGYFCFNDKYHAATLGEGTPMLRQISVQRGSIGWPPLTIMIAQGGPVISHGELCPACSPHLWRARQTSQRMRFQASPSGLFQRAQTDEARQWLQLRYEREFHTHQASVAALQVALFNGIQVSGLALSLRDVRGVVSNVQGGALTALRDQKEIIETLIEL